MWTIYSFFLKKDTLDSVDIGNTAGGKAGRLKRAQRRNCGGTSGVSRIHRHLKEQLQSVRFPSDYF